MKNITGIGAPAFRGDLYRIIFGFRCFIWCHRINVGTGDHRYINLSDCFCFILGIPCYDDEIIDAIAKESGLAKEYVASHAEAAISDEFYGNIIAGRDRDWQSIFDKIWFAQKKVILDLVSKEPCVIVGTCADYIIRDSVDYLSVFVHASDEKRAERIVKVYGKREESPAQRLHDKDAKRKAYYQLYTGTEWGNADNYELCLDSGKIGIDGCVKMISQLYKNKLSQAI